MYTSEAYYAGFHDWTCTTPASRKLSVAISSDMMALLLSSISSMFLNDVRFASDRIAIISLLFAQLNSSSVENLLLAISDLTCLEIRLGDSSIDYMSRVQWISQHMLGSTIEHIIPIFSIVGLDHNRYPGVKSCYLTGEAALVNCDLLELSGLLSSEENRQCALGIPSAPPSTTTANRVSNTPTNTHPSVRPAPHPTQPPTQSSVVAYPPSRGYLGSASSQ